MYYKFKKLKKGEMFKIDNKIYEFDHYEIDENEQAFFVTKTGQKILLDAQVPSVIDEFLKEEIDFRLECFRNIYPKANKLLNKNHDKFLQYLIFNELDSLEDFIDFNFISDAVEKYLK